MVWLQIPGYAEYSLSEKGDLKRKTANRSYMIKSWPASNGDSCVTLWKNGKRKNFMLHNLYSDVFCVSAKEARHLLYEGYNGNPAAVINIRTWLKEKIQECETDETLGVERHDEILYLRRFLAQINSDSGAF